MSAALKLPEFTRVTPYDADEPTSARERGHTYSDGDVLLGKFALSSGRVTDRIVRFGEWRGECWYLGADGDTVSGELVAWRYATVEEIEDFRDCLRDAELERDAYPETIAAALTGGGR